MNPATATLLLLFTASLLYIGLGLLLAWLRVRRATRDCERYLREFSGTGDTPAAEFPREAAS